MKKPTISAPVVTDPTPVNRIVTGGMVKVRATCHLGEQIKGIMCRFEPDEEFELPAARVAALGPLVKIVTLLLLFCALAVSAAPVGLLTRSASGTTSATVMFPGGNEQARVVALDVTSDKAASVVSYRYGATPFRLVSAAAATDTNLYVFSSTLAANDVLFSASVAGAATNSTVHSSNTYPVTILRLGEIVGTNLVAGDTIRKFNSTGYTLTNDASASTTNYSIAATNGLVANDVVAVEHYNTLLVGTVFSVLSNSFNLTANIGTNLSAGAKFYKLTNSHPIRLAAGAAGTTVMAANATNLTTGDILVLSPASGGHFKRTYVDSEAATYQRIALTALVGIPLEADSMVYLRSGAITTPVGATTVRLYQGPVFVLPPNRPAQFVLDGTSACAINQITVDYDK